MKVWKRCFAAVLSFIIFITSANISEAAGTYDSENYIWKANHAEILAEYYGISEKETDVLYNEAINSGYRYILFAPYPNGTKGKRDLMAVDYVNKVVYAKAYNTSGYTWLPTTAVVSAEGEVVETLTLTTGTCYYLNDEYQASQAFTYEGNKYTVEVIYQLSVNISTEEQNRILQIPAIMAQTADNLANQLKGLRLDARTLGEMAPYLYELISLQLPKEETIVRNVSEIEEKMSEISDTEVMESEVTESKSSIVTETIVTYEPALDTIDDAEVIASIQAIYNEYIENEGLILYHLSDEYRNDLKSVLTFADANGAQIRDNSEALYESVDTLKSSMRLKKVINELKEINPESYAKLQYLSSTLSSLNGTARRPGPLRVLKESDNWKILDETIKTSIFKSSYDSEAYAKLESAAYALRSTTVTTPTVSSESIVAAKVTISCDIEIYDVNVSVMAAVMTGEDEAQEISTLDVHSKKVILLAGTSADEIKTAIKESGIENTALSSWNALNSHYQINTSNYDREESGISETLTKDIEYMISYSPKYYKVETNFRGNENLPFGYQMELPMSSDEEISYDYVVEAEDGTKVSYNEGVTYKVTESVKISQMEGSEKTEYRLYDFIVNDVQYMLDENAKQILLNAAVESPTLRIRVPDGSTVGEVTLENGIYSVKADEVSSGILGMSWEPYVAYVMNNETMVQEVMFADGIATWTTSDFTHVKVDYRLKIEKVKNGILNRDLDEIEDVLYALNLPYELVTEVVTQNQLLSGESGITVKTLYSQMNSISVFMSQGMLSVIGNSMTTSEGRDAVRRLQASESQMVISSSGKRMGYGAWNSASGELALYTYMRLCADAEWSLATYYQNGYNQLIKNQTQIVADCLEAIYKDPGLEKLLSTYDQLDKKEKIGDLIPKLRHLADNLKAPHKALKLDNAEFPSLIQTLLSLENQVSAIDSSNGVYAYTSIRRNGENGGALIVSVKAGTKMAKTKEISYVLKEGSHILTEEEVVTVQSYIAELEDSFGLTLEEKQYYDCLATAIPKAGDAVGKNALVSLVYSPKEYTVTVEGMDDFSAKFKYKSDYVIELPAYSENVEEINYYCYLINGEEKRVYNGSVGYHTFTKEDLTTLFTNQHYQIQVNIRQSYSDWDVVPVVTEDDMLIRESFFDFENKLLFLDADPTGITTSEFENNVKFENGFGAAASYAIYNSNRDASKYNYLANGTIVECYSKDKDGEEITTEYTVILMGDVNKDSLVDEKDRKILMKNYLDTASVEEQIQDAATKLAADMNGNGTCGDSNDALQIVLKDMYWENTAGMTYISVLQ